MTPDRNQQTGHATTPTAGRPRVVIADGIAAGDVPALTVDSVGTAGIDRAAVDAAAVALAHRFRTGHIDDLPLDVEVEVVLDGDVEVYHYAFDDAGGVSLDRAPCPDARVRVTMQKAADLVLLERGTALATIVASGRAGLAGELVDVLSTFGLAEHPPAAGRRPFADLSRLLLRTRDAKRREVGKALDAYGREDFAAEMAHLFADATVLSGLHREIDPARLTITIGPYTSLCDISPAGCPVSPGRGSGDPDVSIEVPKMETMIARLLGEIGDMDAILSRQVRVAGPAVDDLMPLFERISTGLTVLTAEEDDSDWSFPSGLPT